MATVFIPDVGVPVDFSECDFVNFGEDGLTAIGANFLPQTLLNAYVNGLFPWYIHEGLPHWFSPDPRMILFPSHLRVSSSMRNVFNRHQFTYTCDIAFKKVMESCAQVKRKNEDSTWINQDFIKAYGQLHDYGYAHSFEAWHGDQLVGGLYGVGIGEVFFGESMFSILPNASKAAFIQAVRFLSLYEFKIIDCQVYTDHLSSLGAIPVDRHAFYDLLVTHVRLPSLNGTHWSELFTQLNNSV
jgi:leucyl/phenylalanyl-tRNA--protein transferase